MKVINLLPKTEQEHLDRKKLLITLRGFLLASVFSYALVVLILLGARVYLEKTLANLDYEIAEQLAIVSKEDNVQLQNQIDNINNITTDYNNLSETSPSWSNILEEFSKLVPEGIKVDTFNANTKSGKIDISGVGNTRDAVLALRSNIAKSEIFKDIDLPLENLQKPTDAQFHYTFYVANP